MANTNLSAARQAKNDEFYTQWANTNKTKLWKASEMDADHVTAWSRGGATDAQSG